MIVTVPSGQIESYEGDSPNVEMRILSHRSFVDSDGTAQMPGTIHRGAFYKRIPCSITDNVLTYPTFEIASTTDISSRHSYTFALYDGDGRYLSTMFDKIRVPDENSTRTLQQLIAYNEANVPVDEDTGYSKDQIDTMLGALTDAAPKASDAVIGVAKLTKAPASAVNPIAVGANDDSYVGIAQTKYLNGYASLAAAVTAIGSTPTHLKITTAGSISDNLSIPATCIVSFEGNGKVTVAANKTLTIGKMTDPGNRQVFVQADKTANVRFAAGAVEKMNVAWLADDADLSNVIDQYLASCNTNSGGRIYLPAGTWTTNGNHLIKSGTHIYGDGVAITTLKLTATDKAILKVGEIIYNTHFAHLTLDGDNKADSIGLLFAGTAPNTSGHANLHGVKIRNCSVGLDIDGTNSWQLAALNIDAESYFESNGIGLRCNSENNLIRCWANFYAGAGQWCLDLIHVGGAAFYSCEFAGPAGYFGDYQIEANTVVAAGGITGNGRGKSVVTIAGMTNSPKTVYVENLTTTEHTTATLIAAAFAKALANDPDVCTAVHVAQSGAQIKLITLDEQATDATMNFTIENDTCTGITNSTTSTLTNTPGANTGMAEGVLKLTGGRGGPISFYNCQDEGFKTFLQNDSSDFNGVVNIYGGIVQAAMRLNQTMMLNIDGTAAQPKILRDGANSASIIRFNGHCRNWVYDHGSPVTQHIVEARIDNFGNVGGSVLSEDIKTLTWDARRGLPLRFTERTNTYFQAATDPTIALMSPREKNALRIGLEHQGGGDWFYYDIYRKYADGRLQIQGNQAGYVGLDFNGDIDAAGAIKSPAFLPDTIILTPGANIDLPVYAASNFKLTPDQNTTLTVSGMTEGQKFTVAIKTSGTSSYTITFGGDFLPSGTLATGSTDGKIFIIEFKVEYGKAVETGRTPAM